VSTLIAAGNIYKSFGELKVLKGINLEIKKAEIVAITGPSGAGKSTLLHILGSLDVPDQGTVTINDTDIFKLSPKKIARFRNEHIGFVFQSHYLLPEFTALENVCIPAFIGGKTRNKSIERAKELLDFLGLTERISHKPSELSGGEQQRVAIARALINNPDIILADEPSGNLDTNNAEELHRLFIRLRNEMLQTFLIVTHNLHLAQSSDRIVKMQDGFILP